jgi:exodeoxyribonuclease VII large subunit
VPHVTSNFTVAELSTRLSETLAEAFADDVWVTGEIRDLSRSNAGHVYFQLVEPPDAPGGRVRAALSVVLFDSNRRAVNAMLRRTGSVRMTDGVQVRIRAALELYPPTGRLQLRMVGIDPFHTLGALEAERERVLRALAADDLIERNGRLPFPSAPQRVGVVTSAGSAAHADFVDELTASGMAWDIVLADVRVQGDRAELSIVAALDRLVRERVDVVALVRGGGARTDLATFDREEIARAIARCPVPVVTGIGHEVDSSVADAVAARSFKTPTACAAALVALSSDALRQADGLWAAIVARSHDRLLIESERLRANASEVVSATRRDLEAAERLAVLAGHRLEREAGHALARSSGDLDRLAGAVAGSGRHLVRAHDAELDRHRRTLTSRGTAALDHATRRVDALAARAGVLDPARTLARGWSITRTPDGQIVRSVDDVDPGATLVTTLADGRLTSTVDHRPDDPNDRAHGATDG